MAETPIPFDDVEILSDGSGLGFTCRIGARDLFIGSAIPLPGTTVRRPGDRGRLVLPRWFVEKHELAAGS